MADYLSLDARLVPITSLLAIALGTVFVLGVGCSDNSSKSTDETTYTYNVTDASVPDNVTETGACVRYVVANCLRRNECLGTSDDCFGPVGYCPDVLFSEGSTRTAATTWACAEALRTRACEDLAVGRNPDCVTPGMRGIGESCIGAAQCASLACSGSADTCGVCLARRAQGQPCADAPCSAGLLCDTTTGTCILPDALALDTLLSKAPLKLDAPCEAQSVCEESTYCAIADGETVGTCRPRKTLVEGCHASKECVRDAYCAMESIRCTALPTEGGRCGTDFELNVSMWCDSTTYCDDATGTCTKLPAVGTPCASNLQLNNVPALCAEGTYCDSSVAPPTCQAMAQPGTVCLDNTTCAPGLDCLCEEVNCATRSCAIRREFGDSCSGAGERCLVQAGSCVNGLCQPNPSQGRFASVCGT